MHPVIVVVVTSTASPKAADRSSLLSLFAPAPSRGQSSTASASGSWRHVALLSPGHVYHASRPSSCAEWQTHLAKLSCYSRCAHSWSFQNFAVWCSKDSKSSCSSQRSLLFSSFSLHAPCLPSQTHLALCCLWRPCGLSPLGAGLLHAGISHPSPSRTFYRLSASSPSLYVFSPKAQSSPEGGGFVLQLELVSVLRVVHFRPLELVVPCESNKPTLPAPSADPRSSVHASFPCLPRHSPQTWHGSCSFRPCELDYAPQIGPTRQSSSPSRRLCPHKLCRWHLDHDAAAVKLFHNWHQPNLCGFFSPC
mmetsp:Transcript_8792/g.14981  ORF Transcript_8792/g.14981 Transcript_8792/m.14981 type:complete len:307 (-) Transcript_8792:612-1532(-)